MKRDIALITAAICLCFGMCGALDAETIYEQCGAERRCVGFTSDASDTECVSRKDCVMVTSWMRDELGVYNFEVQITLDRVDDGNHWVAVGLSRDLSMGDDAVVMSSEYHGSLPFWNVDFGVDGEGNPIKASVEVDVYDEAALNTIYVEGFEPNLYANFARNAEFSFMTPDIGEDPSRLETFDLDSEAFYLLLSCGNFDTEMKPHKHKFNAISAEKIDFAAAA